MSSWDAFRTKVATRGFYEIGYTGRDETPPAAAAPAPRPSPGAAIAALLTVAAPAGWERTEYANAGGADAVLAFEKGSDRLAVNLYGAPGSFYKTPDEFLKGPAATTMGRPPEKAGTAVVAGAKRARYRHGVPLMDGDPHVPPSGPPRLGRGEFVVLPPAPDGRFLVLSYERLSPVPDPTGDSEKAWKYFLKSARPAKAHAP
ncbi:MAG: hypothetical protein HY079_06875 [Elusimicrobia bacterium]|nr:hypothetical protein [Elusimicrobiota bacterium]